MAKGRICGYIELELAEEIKKHHQKRVREATNQFLETPSFSDTIKQLLIAGLVEVLKENSFRMFQKPGCMPVRDKLLTRTP